MNHRHASEEELLDRILDGAAVDPESAACARCSAARAELEGFLATCREAAASSAPEPLASDRLVGRVLARTTREDLAWRGDLALLADFVGQRLRASRGLRLAAASLLAHLLVLPVFAWLALRPVPHERSFRVHLEQREQTLPAVPQEPELELERLVLPDPLPGESGSGAEPSTATRVRRLERAHLTGVGAPRVAVSPMGPGGPGGPRGHGDPGDALDPALAGLLELRADRLAGRADPEVVRRASPELATPLARVLWVELLMDHLVLVGERLPALDAGLERIGGGASGPDRPGELLALELLALERAQALGLLGAAGPARIEALAAESGSSAPPAGEVGSRGFGRALAELLGEPAAGWAGWDR